MPTPIATILPFTPSLTISDRTVEHRYQLITMRATDSIDIEYIWITIRVLYFYTFMQMLTGKPVSYHKVKGASTVKNVVEKDDENVQISFLHCY